MRALMCRGDRQAAAAASHRRRSQRARGCWSHLFVVTRRFSHREILAGGVRRSQGETSTEPGCEVAHLCLCVCLCFVCLSLFCVFRGCLPGPSCPRRSRRAPKCGRQLCTRRWWRGRACQAPGRASHRLDVGEPSGRPCQGPLQALGRALGLQGFSSWPS